MSAFIPMRNTSYSHRSIFNANATIAGRPKGCYYSLQGQVKRPYAIWTYRFVDKASRLARDGFYLLLISGSVVVIGSLLYELGKSIWVERDIQALYDQLCDKLLKDEEILVALGEPVQIYRDRKGLSMRLPVYHIDHHPNELKRLCMEFYMIGKVHHAIVSAEFDMVQEESPVWKEHLVLVTSPGANFSKCVTRPKVAEEPKSVFSWLFGGLVGSR